jgi:hypothetical protein
MRLCGGSLPHVVERYTGISHPSATARWLVGRPIEARPIRRNALCSTRSVRHVFLINQAEGVARSENYVAQLRELKTCRALKSNLRQGHPARRTVDMATSPGYLYLVGAESDVLADYGRIRQLEEAGLYTH